MSDHDLAAVRNPSDAESPASSAVTVRPLATHDELRACVELQRETWGSGFDDCMPPSFLKVIQRIGGIAAGAFDRAGRLVGFVFGVTGVENGRLVHWSHMLAVRPEWRDHGLGRLLKLYQREAVARLGVEGIYWTFDPLVARNAHLNLNRLGARVVEYVEDMYDSTGSDLHADLGTDRLVVAWPVHGVEPDGADAAVDGSGFESANLAAFYGTLPVVNGVDWDDVAVEGTPAIRIEVPADVFAAEAAERGAGARWRQETRRAFQGAFSHGYQVRRFYRDPATNRCFYVLSRGDAAT